MSSLLEMTQFKVSWRIRMEMSPVLATWETHVKYKRMSGLEIKHGCE